MLKVAICDDYEVERDWLYYVVGNKIRPYHICDRLEQYENGSDLLLEMTEDNRYDLVFLDIKLNNENGIDIAERLKKKNPYCYIVFVSGYEEYHRAAFDVQPYQFLDKPVREEEIEAILDSVINLRCQKDNVLEIPTKRANYRLVVNDIMYFITGKREITVYMRDGQTYPFYGKLSEIERRLANLSDYFLRAHKSYLLNMNYVKVFERDDIIMQDERKFLISARKQKEVIDRYLQFVITHGGTENR